MERVDALALSPDHARILASFAQDTGGCRLNNRQASELAEACAAALNLIAVRGEVSHACETIAAAERIIDEFMQCAEAGRPEGKLISQGADCIVHLRAVRANIAVERA